MRWNEMSRPRRRMLVLAAATELVLTSAAAADLWSRPRAAVRGRKALWWPAIFVQPLGPVVYLVWGRRRQP
ncbi:PLDc N-terminal domain-containing protein [Actinomadura sp. ATCC 31491]|uniref:PLDc N-terminal domain-containing protein n=1 Tax=Actinomadura luzonensis TaxID=2805427 RepID=A0ABT0G4Y5_9ACTN|nr:PLDc N-terminal domain-containing protein [Actinomadura luzonensis]MCK2219453.1 PLDc N-terminal domain-containing protein [Actinomadura luzonensis]